MSDSLLFSSLFALTCGILLITYSHRAGNSGMNQGTFYSSGKAAILGFVGVAITIASACSKSELTDVVIVGLIAFFITMPFAFKWFGEKVQIFAPIGLAIGVILTLSAR